MQKELHYYDLDGTLSPLNSTWDFVEGYLFHRKKYSRIFYAKAIRKYIRRNGGYDPYRYRIYLINLFFSGLKVKDLEEYFHSVYKPKFLETLTDLGKELLANPKTAHVMLTGCTEVPARWIGDIFGFDEVISTEFSFKNGKIGKCITDTYGNHKIKFIKNTDAFTIYYTDELRSETTLIDIMDKIVEV